MRLTFLGKGGSNKDGCPSLFATDQDTYVVLGWRTDRPETVEIPHLLTGYLQPRTYIGATLTDTGRGTFTVSGAPLTDSDTLDQLTMETYETAIEVPRKERTYFGTPTDD
ncbi:hypothetical protein ACWEO2_19685 [Nocardia sp. NPDC004278]